MTLRTGHGNGAGVPRIEVLPADELPAPIQAAPEAAASAPLARRPDGTFDGSEAAREAGRRGGRARARRVALVDSLGLAKLDEAAEFQPYRKAAEDFVREHLAALATQAGGYVGPGPSSLVASAALQLAASRFCFDRGALSADPVLLKQGSSLANDSRQNLLAAYELAVREAEASGETDDERVRRERLATMGGRRSV